MKIFSGILLLCLPISCVTTTSADRRSADRPVVVGTLDLFAQNEIPLGGKSWAGDWEFRRDRLELVDKSLREIRPDIMIFQNALKRVGSLSEQDDMILKAGSLLRYEWQDLVIDSDDQTGEEVSLSVAVLRPGKIAIASTDKGRSYWSMGADGHIAVFEVLNFGEPILLLNIVMPSRVDQLKFWLAFVRDRIFEIIRSGRGCSSRIIVAGAIPESSGARGFSEAGDAFTFKDTGSGLCQNAARCVTATSQNQIFALTRPNVPETQWDRIYVPSTTLVSEGGVSFNVKKDTNRYESLYKLSSVWASQRFGWTSKIRLAECSGVQAL